MKIAGIVCAFFFCLSIFSAASFAQHSYKDVRSDNQSSKLDLDPATAPNWMDILGSGLDSIHHAAMQLHDSLVKSKLESVKKIVDSVRKQAKKLKDSLNYEGGGNLGELFNKFDLKGLIGDSLLNNLKSIPDQIQENMKKTQRMPMNPFELPPSIKPFEWPVPEKKKREPIPGFKGWYYEKLAEV